MGIKIFFSLSARAIKLNGLLVLKSPVSSMCSLIIFQNISV
jgi:hypothetical protein